MGYIVMMEVPLPALTVKSVRNKCVEQESNLLQNSRGLALQQCMSSVFDRNLF